MKRIPFFLVAMLLISTALTGQKKPKLSKIESMYKSGDIAGAMEMVNAAETYEKTKDNKKTYFLKGLVYMRIDTAGLDLAENPRQIAIEAFNKYEELEDEGKETSFITNSGFYTYTQIKESYYGHYFNQAAIAYADENYAAALDNFEKAGEIMPTDTTAFLYAGYAASNSDQHQRAKPNYERAIELGLKGKDPWHLLNYIYATVDGDKEKALEITREAIKRWPDDNEFRRNEIQLLIEMEKVDEARTNLELAIENEPNDPKLHFSLGVMYDNLAETKESEAEKEELQNKALEAYKRAVEVDSNYTNAYYNMGIILLNRANEVINESNNLGYSAKDLKRAEQLEPIIIARLKEALPNWEKVNELEPNNLKVLEMLQYFYVQLKMMDKAEAIMDQLDALEEAGN